MRLKFLRVDDDVISGTCRGEPTRALPGYFCTLYIYMTWVSLNVLRARACISCPELRGRDVARGHGLWRSRVNLESVDARSVHVHSHLCLPGLLLVSAGASGRNPFKQEKLYVTFAMYKSTPLV